MKRLAVVAVVIAMAMLAACGGKSSSTTTQQTVTVSLSPATATVAGGKTQQFTATVAGSTTTTVTWQVNSTTGGDATHGTISSTGLYTAPALAPTPNTVTVSAISTVASSAIGTAVVTITAGTAIVISPGAATIAAGSQQTFTASVGTQSLSPVWSVHCQSSAVGACGAISASGVYTAPLSPPPGGTVSVTAATSDNSAISGNANLTIQFGNGTLVGPYAFSFMGQTSTGGFAEAGSISFDGSGKITGGALDRNLNGVSSIAITGGSYTVGVDGRGSATVQTAGGNFVIKFAVVNHGRAYAIRTSDASTTGVTGSGTLEAQDRTQFNAATLAGEYALNVAGLAGSAATAPVAGSINLFSGGVIPPGGVLDVSGQASLQNVNINGTYTAPDANGRGTITLASTNSSSVSLSFAYYVVDGTHLKLLETTSGTTTVTGDLFRQNSGPFTLNSLNGRYAFTLSGSTAAGAAASAGALTSDGNGNIGDGTLDMNNSGTAQSGAFTGTYIATDPVIGRFVLTLTVNGAPAKFAAYPRADGRVTLLQLDAGNSLVGAALPQTLSSASISLLTGNFAIGLSGTDLTTTREEDVTGRLVLPGGSTFSGTLDVLELNAAGGVTVATTNTAAAGGFTVQSTTGRGTANFTSDVPNLSSAKLVIYVVDANTLLVLENDNARTLVGIAQKQY